MGRKREGEGVSGGEREQTLNQLLVEMDGFDVRAGVVVMGTSPTPPSTASTTRCAGSWPQPTPGHPVPGANHQLLRSLAERLEEIETLEGDELDDFLAQAVPSPSPGPTGPWSQA